MTPYYQDDLVTIYHGDCRQVLPSLPPIGVLITDPPYGYSYSSGRARWSGVFDGGAYADASGAIQGDTSTALRDGVLSTLSDVPWVVFGNLRSIVPGSRGVLVWDKGDAAGMGDLSFPWKPNWELVFFGGEGFTGARTSGVLRATNISRISMGRAHPTEKPVALLRQIIAKCPPGLILDPFMGSGTTLRAAKDLSRKAIGIEIEERYCEIAAERCRQEVLDFGGAA